jgi:hypothetical protein
VITISIILTKMEEQREQCFLAVCVERLWLGRFIEKIHFSSVCDETAFLNGVQRFSLEWEWVGEPRIAMAKTWGQSGNSEEGDNKFSYQSKPCLQSQPHDNIMYNINTQNVSLFVIKTPIYQVWYRAPVFWMLFLYYYVIVLCPLVCMSLCCHTSWEHVTINGAKGRKHNVWYPQTTVILISGWEGWKHCSVLTQETIHLNYTANTV